MLRTTNQDSSKHLLVSSFTTMGQVMKNKDGLHLWGGEEEQQRKKARIVRKIEATTREELEREIQLKKKLCKICGDIARSLHFGGLSCDSCKAFFRRSIKNNSYKSFECAKSDGSCVVTVGNRKRCQACRFRQCLKAGMEISLAVAKKEEEVQFPENMNYEKTAFSLERPRGDHIQHILEKYSHTEPVEYSKSVDDVSFDYSTPLPYISQSNEKFNSTLQLPDHSFTTNSITTEGYLKSMLDPSDYQEILQLQELMVDLCQKIPLSFFPVETTEAIYLAYRDFLRRCVQFFTRSKFYKLLAPVDCPVLLRNALRISTLLAGTHLMEIQTKTWPRHDSIFASYAPSITASEVIKLINSPLYVKVLEFFIKYNSVYCDDKVVVLMQTISLFYSSSDIVDLQTVHRCRDYYIRLLKNYLNVVHGKCEASRIYAVLMRSLKDAVELFDVFRCISISAEISDSVEGNPTLPSIFADTIEKIKETAYETVLGMLKKRLDDLGGRTGDSCDSPQDLRLLPCDRSFIKDSEILLSDEQIDYLRTMVEKLGLESKSPAAVAIRRRVSFCHLHTLLRAIEKVK